MKNKKRMDLKVNSSWLALELKPILLNLISSFSEILRLKAWIEVGFLEIN